jgi:hypothetical protein
MTSALWNNLLEAFGETVLAGVLFVTLFSFGVRTLGRNHGGAASGGTVSGGLVSGGAVSGGLVSGTVSGGTAQASETWSRPQPPGTWSAPQAPGSAPQAPGSLTEGVNVSEAGAVLCFVLCFVIVVFGIYLAATK